MRAQLVALGLAVILVGCGGGGETTDDVPASIDLVRYTQGGGIGGIYEFVRVRPTGTAEVSSGYPEQGQRTVEFRLTRSEFGEVRAAVEAAPPLEVEATETLCADCFEYAVEIGEERIEFDSVDLDEGNVSPEVEELVALLEDLAAEHAKPPRSSQ